MPGKTLGTIANLAGIKGGWREKSAVGGVGKRRGRGGDQKEEVGGEERKRERAERERESERGRPIRKWRLEVLAEGIQFML